MATGMPVYIIQPWCCCGRPDRLVRGDLHCRGLGDAMIR